MSGPSGVVIRVGTKAGRDFTVSEKDQEAFACLSGDRNPIHLDAAFAGARGFAAPVVFGALMVAKLSDIIGMELPGSAGLWSGVQMDFRTPLLVGQPARMDATVTQVSESTRSLVLKVTVRTAEALIATGRAMATYLP